MRAATNFGPWGQNRCVRAFDLRGGGGGVARVFPGKVADAPGLSQHLMSLRRIAEAGNTCIGSPEGILMKYQEPRREVLILPPCLGQSYDLYGYLQR